MTIRLASEQDRGGYGPNFLDKSEFSIGHPLVRAVQDRLADRATEATEVLDAMLRLMGKTVVHLDSCRTKMAACGTETDNVSAEHNDMTCPLCFCVHEAICAASDSESPYFEDDVDSILADEYFVAECLNRCRIRC